MAVEVRGLSTELRASDDAGKRRIAGYTAVSNKTAEIGGPGSLGGGFREQIDPRALDACLQGNPDIRCWVRPKIWDGSC